MKAKIFSFFVVPVYALKETCTKTAGRGYDFHKEPEKDFEKDIPNILMSKEIKNWTYIENLELERCVKSEEALETRLFLQITTDEGDEVPKAGYSIGLSVELINKLKQMSVLTVHVLLAKFSKNDLKNLAPSELVEIQQFLDSLDKLQKPIVGPEGIA